MAEGAGGFLARFLSGIADGASQGFREKARREREDEIFTKQAQKEKEKMEFRRRNTMEQIAHQIGVDVFGKEGVVDDGRDLTAKPPGQEVETEGLQVQDLEGQTATLPKPDIPGLPDDFFEPVAEGSQDIRGGRLSDAALSGAISGRQLELERQKLLGKTSSGSAKPGFWQKRFEKILDRDDASARIAADFLAIHGHANVLNDDPNNPLRDELLSKLDAQAGVEAEEEDFKADERNIQDLLDLQVEIDNGNITQAATLASRASYVKQLDRIEQSKTVDARIDSVLQLMEDYDALPESEKSIFNKPGAVGGFRNWVETHIDLPGNGPGARLMRAIHTEMQFFNLENRKEAIGTAQSARELQNTYAVFADGTNTPTAIRQTMKVWRKVAEDERRESTNMKTNMDNAVGGMVVNPQNFIRMMRTDRGRDLAGKMFAPKPPPNINSGIDPPDVGTDGRPKRRY